MAKRGMDFFIRRDELTAFIWAQAEKRNLVVLMHAGNETAELAQTPGVLQRADDRHVWAVHLAPEIPTSLPTWNDSGALVAQLGGVTFFIPREENSILTDTRFTTHSIWNDAHGEYHENPQTLKLYASICYVLRKQLRYPMWCYQTQIGPLHMTRASWLGYTTGAADWCVSGKRLRQGQGLVGYSISEQIHEDLGREFEQSRG